MTQYPVEMSINPDVEAFFDAATNTISYIVADPNSSACAIYDSVLGIDYPAGQLSYVQADHLIEVIRAGASRWSGSSRPMSMPTI